MNICIVTLYKTHNSGSYWQAYALKRYLEKQDHKVYILKINYKLKTALKPYNRFIKKILKLKLKASKNEYKIIKKFHKKQRELNLIEYKKAIRKMELFIFGSDTIWNIDSDNILFLRKIFFGNLMMNKRKIAYAASFANTKYNKIIKYGDIIKGINDFENISVRDNHSLDIIEKIYKKNAYLVIDPTLLLNKRDYMPFIKKIEFKYIYVYTFSDLSNVMVNELRQIASIKGLKIISGIHEYEWCNERAPNDPDSFLSYIFNAEYVITDTFHGSIFSTIFEKNFVTINRNKNKVNNYLISAGLDDRLIKKEDSINKIIKHDINYETINKKLDNEKKISKDFLKNI